ncbi:hypothetical protein, partial [Burkholderia lata]|uniref:hypothetical protein n=1 Tax=Burkholderia lata (strain ATCC 17760 / DSM 23089 / LMG 22485 / NCIMB 9086 / R18194 / 383) TaxID=482957 RepID=UPI001C2E74E6
PSGITLWHHPLASPSGITLWHHLLASPAGITCWRHLLPFLSAVSLCRLRLASPYPVANRALPIRNRPSTRPDGAEQTPAALINKAPTQHTAA